MAPPHFPKKILTEDSGAIDRSEPLSVLHTLNPESGPLAIVPEAAISAVAVAGFVSMLALLAAFSPPGLQKLWRMTDCFRECGPFFPPPI